MKTIHKAITVITLAAVLICMTASIKAKADTIEASEVLAANVPGADLTSIAYAYNNLTTQQKLIADYLMGAYNYTYLCGRGFSFNIDQTETNMKAQLGAIGERIWQYATTAYGWKSRFNETFRQYASSIIVYAANESGTFNDWISEILSGTRNVYIEYSDNAFDAWTEFYNDPSGDGIAHFGETVSSWNSGNLQDFAFVGSPWYSSADEQAYNSFILNYSPVVYSGIVNNGSQSQCIYSFKNLPLIDSLYIRRDATYQYARFGFSDSITDPYSLDYDMASVTLYYRNNKLMTSNQVNSWIRPRGTFNHVSASLADLVNYCFNQTPFNPVNDIGSSGSNPLFWYPYIQHVYLVDDLTTLANKEEVLNISDFNIIPPGMDDYIITPNGKMLIPGYAPMTDPFDDLWEVSVDIDNNPASEDDYSTQIVNNTVINNYTIDASDKINVPVDWFDNELSDQLANDSIPFLSFARDCIDTLGDLQIYFYGAIVFGLGGGVLKKLLL